MQKHCSGNMQEVVRWCTVLHIMSSHQNTQWTPARYITDVTTAAEMLWVSCENQMSMQACIIPYNSYKPEDVLWH